jgi:hypothetical protein
MSKIEIVERIRQAVLHKGKPLVSMKPSTYLQIFIKESQTDQGKFYTQIPWYSDIACNVPDEADAKMLEKFLLSDPSE